MSSVMAPVYRVAMDRRITLNPLLATVYTSNDAWLSQGSLSCIQESLDPDQASCQARPGVRPFRV